MKNKFIVGLLFSMVAANAIAVIPTVDAEEACKVRLSAYVSGLEVAAQQVKGSSEAKVQLSVINGFSPSLSACDKIKLIPALAKSERALETASESIK